MVQKAIKATNHWPIYLMMILGVAYYWAYPYSVQDEVMYWESLYQHKALNQSWAWLAYPNFFGYGPVFWQLSAVLKSFIETFTTDEPSRFLILKGVFTLFHFSPLLLLVALFPQTEDRVKVLLFALFILINYYGFWLGKIFSVEPLLVFVICGAIWAFHNQRRWLFYLLVGLATSLKLYALVILALPLGAVLGEFRLEKAFFQKHSLLLLKGGVVVLVTFLITNLYLIQDPSQFFQNQQTDRFIVLKLSWLWKHFLQQQDFNFWPNPSNISADGVLIGGLFTTYLSLPVFLVGLILIFRLRKDLFFTNLLTYMGSSAMFATVTNYFPWYWLPVFLLFVYSLHIIPVKQLGLLLWLNVVFSLPIIIAQHQNRVMAGQAFQNAPILIQQVQAKIQVAKASSDTILFLNLTDPIQALKAHHLQQVPYVPVYPAMAYMFGFNRRALPETVIKSEEPPKEIMLLVSPFARKSLEAVGSRYTKTNFQLGEYWQPRNGAYQLQKTDTLQGGWLYHYQIKFGDHAQN